MAGIKKKVPSKNFVKQRIDSLNKLFDTLSESLQRNLNDLLKQAGTAKQRGGPEISRIFDSNIRSILSVVENTIQENLHKALVKMNVPTMDEVRKLEKKIDELNKRIAKLKKQL